MGCPSARSKQGKAGARHTPTRSTSATALHEKFIPIDPDLPVGRRGSVLTDSGTIFPGSSQCGST
jgi:hypothetical protein